MVSECHNKQNPNLNFINGEEKELPKNHYFLDRLSLFKTRSNFFLVGRDKGRRFWRVLKIDRSEPLKLNLFEDPSEYSWLDCCILLQGINDGNLNFGGLRFVTVCYGIVGFIKFLGPYYMFLITERKAVGDVCGHLIYAISKYRLIRIPRKSVVPKVINHSEENRYKKLLCILDFRDYYFSYSYDLMHSLQHNICGNDATSRSYESTFSWNGFLAKEIRNILGNDLWTVALVHGFFKQVKLSRFGYKFSLTLIARRSRQHAGTRYLTRGVNEEGQAANDVEIEQIVCGEIYGGLSYKITSVVQNRGSVPLIWCQPASWLNFKPQILLRNMGHSLEATKRHFEEVTRRYGSPIVILNLLKCCDHPRESVLGDALREAVDTVNAGLEKAKQLEFMSFDLDGFFQNEGSSVLTHLNLVTEEVLDCIKFLSYEVLPPSRLLQPRESLFGSVEEMKKSEKECGINKKLCSYHTSNKPRKIQNGVLRSNCVDCLDRTNVAQFVYGSAALGYQLHALGIIEASEVDSLDESLVDTTMEVYKNMGDVLAWQYGGSASRCKIFCEKKGEWKPAIMLKEIAQTLQRYFSNVFMDIKKQNAIDLFLGYTKPAADLGNDHSSGDENLVLSSSQSNCFLCDGMSYNSPGISESKMTITSDRDDQDTRYSYALSEMQARAITDIEE